jgi:hypothetical protein
LVDVNCIHPGVTQIRQRVLEATFWAGLSLGYRPSDELMPADWSVANQDLSATDDALTEVAHRKAQPGKNISIGGLVLAASLAVAGLIVDLSIYSGKS